MLGLRCFRVPFSFPFEDLSLAFPLRADLDFGNFTSREVSTRHMTISWCWWPLMGQLQDGSSESISLMLSQAAAWWSLDSQTGQSHLMRAGEEERSELESESERRLPLSPPLRWTFLASL